MNAAKAATSLPKPHFFFFFSIHLFYISQPPLIYIDPYDCLLDSVTINDGFYFKTKLSEYFPSQTVSLYSSWIPARPGG